MVMMKNIKTIESALEHFAWKLQNVWNITDKDIEAFNLVSSYVDKKQKQQLIDNQLFGKLYIYLFGEFVNYYRATVLDDIPQKELHKLLSKDLRQIVQEVTDRLNLLELENYVKKNDIKGYKPMEYDEVAENLRVMVNGALNIYGSKQ